MQVPALLPRAADCLECFTLHAGVPTSSQSSQSCQCWAFKDCPAQRRGWSCNQLPPAPEAAQDSWQMHEADFLSLSLNASHSHEKMEDLLQAGSCRCRQEISRRISTLWP
ncbi:unnamed protein product [Effrenium voratum]|nr:unnamed protein product [Effrenium voratum]CAJ1437479.1 unnamed protein product [Effrenium voratum]